MTMPLSSSQRLGMLAAVESVQTPLTRVNGMERGVLVSGKGDEDVVEMVVLLRGGKDRVIVLEEGLTELSPEPDWAAFFFRKKAGSVPVPTTLHVVLRNG